MFANPAAFAMRTASTASPGVWMRPMSLSKRASKLCTPMESRLTPIPRYARSFSIVSVPGLASSETSAPGARGNASRTAASAPAMYVSGTSEGVPPPKNTVSTRCISSPAARISPQSAAKYVSHAASFPG